MGHMGTHAAAVALYPKLAYHPLKNFEPIGLAAGTPVLIVARKDFPAKDLKEFAAYVKANADKMNAAHAGIGSVSFTSCLLLNSVLGVKPTAIPFQGTGPALNALLGGQVDYMCDQIVNLVPQIQSGNIKAYGIGTPERNPALPDVPTTKEAGLPQFDVSAWNALFAPKGTPKEVLDKLSDALSKALDDEGVRKRLLDLGSDIPGPDRRGQAALNKLVESEIDALDAGDPGLRHYAVTGSANFADKGRPSGRPFFMWGIGYLAGDGSDALIGSDPAIRMKLDAAISRSDGTRASRRRGEARPHRHRHAVGIRPSDALRPARGISAGHHQEAACEIDRA